MRIGEINGWNNDVPIRGGNVRGGVEEAIKEGTSQPTGYSSQKNTKRGKRNKFPAEWEFDFKK